MSTTKNFIPYDVQIFVESQIPTKYSRSQTIGGVLHYYPPRELEFDSEDEYLNFIRINMTNTFNQEYPNNQILDIQIGKAKSAYCHYPITSRLSIEINGKSYAYDFYYPSIYYRSSVNQGFEASADVFYTLEDISPLFNADYGGTSTTKDLYVEELENPDITMKDIVEYNCGRLLNLLKDSSFLNKLKYTFYCILKRYTKYPFNKFLELRNHMGHIIWSIRCWIDKLQKRFKFSVGSSTCM